MTIDALFGDGSVEGSGSTLMEDADRLQHLGRTAAILSGDAEVERATAERAQKARDDQRFFDATANEIEELARRVKERLGGALQDGAEGSSAAEADARSQQLEQVSADLVAAQAQAKACLAAEERRVRAILSEHDHIRKLLAGGGSATDSQFDVMAFPRTANTKTRILEVRGSAGTGKTLCLLAKLIQDTRPSHQLGLLPEKRKQGLFICFNKALKKHVQTLLSRIEGADANIEVVHFDQFVYQLVRARPSEEFAHLAPYASASRFTAPSDGSGAKWWDLIYQDRIHLAVSDAMQAVALAHPAQAREYYLDAALPENVEWVSDELAWLEARYEDPDEARGLYPDARRIGRGTARQPNAAIRFIILEVWEAFRHLLEERHQYTMEQAVKRLLHDPELPRYDAIAIDEVQDLTVASVRLLTRMRAGEESRVYLCGDENQKIYKRDFSWRELDENLVGHAISLKENKRNSPAIEAFANRLIGIASSKEAASDLVFMGAWPEQSVADLIGRIRDAHPQETIALISGNVRAWNRPLRERGISALNAREDGVGDPGLYLIGELAAKGLEFDTVIVDCAWLHETDEATLKSILYVNCTRARHRLYVRYAGEPPALLQRYYADFLTKPSRANP